MNPSVSLVILWNSILLLNILAATQTRFLDLNNSQQVLLHGQFSAQSFSLVNATFPGQNHLYRRYNGTIVSVGKIAAQGKVLCGCRISPDEVIFAGSFSEISGVKSANIIGFNLINQTYYPLLEGLDGVVKDLLCDTKENTVYAVGSFKQPVGDDFANVGQGIIGWKQGHWLWPSWKGLLGEVNAISWSENNSQLYLAGSFTESLDSPRGIPSDSQPLSLEGAEITASAPADQNAASITCGGSTGNNPWILPDASKGFWKVLFANPASVIMLRLQNLKGKDRSTKTFNLTPTDSSPPLTLEYFDQELQSWETCSSDCPLSSSKDYQDFKISSTMIRDFPGLIININSWNGLGAGLSTVTFFQSKIIVYADNRLNFAPCFTVESSPPKTILQGTWEAAANNSLQRSISGAVSNPLVTFLPNIPEDGNYDIWLVNPACQGEDECSRRARVSLIVKSKPKVAPLALDVNLGDQANRKRIYSGFLTRSTNSFKPSVEIYLNSASSTPVTIAVTAVEITRNATISNARGLLSFDKATFGNPKSLLDPSFVLPNDANFLSLASTRNAVLVGGKFTLAAMNVSNIAQIKQGQLVGLAGLGVDGPVNSLQGTSEDFYVGGDFRRTADGQLFLNSTASYNPASQSWKSLEGGVNGSITRLILNENRTSVHFYGQFDALYINNANTTDVQNYAVWDIPSKSWSGSPYLRGQVNGAAIADTPFEENNFISGQFERVEAVASPTIALLNPRGIYSSSGFYLNNTLKNPSSLIRTATFFNITQQNKTSSWIAAVGELSPFGGLIFSPADQNNWQNIQGDIAASEVHVLTGLNDQVYLGGSFKGAVRAWSGSRKSFDQTMENNLKDTSDNAIVRAIKRRPGLHSVIAAGTFSRLHGSSCIGICEFNSTTEKWQSLGKGLYGDVHDLSVQEERIIAIGNISPMRQKSPTPNVVTFDYGDKEWNMVELDKKLPGIPLKMAAFNKTIFLSGTGNHDQAYFYQLKDEQVRDIGQALRGSKNVRQLSMVPIYDTKMAKSSNMLLAVGDIIFSNQGQVGKGKAFGAALWDGTGWTPFSEVELNDPGQKGQLWGVVLKNDLGILAKMMLALPLIVLIAAAIGLGVIFALVAIGVAVVYGRRKSRSPEDEKTGRKAAAGGGILSIGTEATAKAEESRPTSMVSPSTRDSIAQALTAAALSGPYQLADYQTYYAMYPFNATEPGELDLNTGDRIYVLDNSDEVWWMGMVDNGPEVPPSQGVFPASYVSLDPPSNNGWSIF